MTEHTERILEINQKDEFLRRERRKLDLEDKAKNIERICETYDQQKELATLKANILKILSEKEQLEVQIIEYKEILKVETYFNDPKNDITGCYCFDTEENEYGMERTIRECPHLDYDSNGTSDYANDYCTFFHEDLEREDRNYDIKPLKCGKCEITRHKNYVTSAISSLENTIEREEEWDNNKK